MEEIKARTQYGIASNVITEAGALINLTLMKNGKVDADFLADMKRTKTNLFGLGVKFKHVTAMIGSLVNALSYAIQYAEGDSPARNKALFQAEQFNRKLKAFERKWSDLDGI